MSRRCPRIRVVIAPCTAKPAATSAPSPNRPSTWPSSRLSPCASARACCQVATSPIAPAPSSVTARCTAYPVSPGSVSRSPTTWPPGSPTAEGSAQTMPARSPGR